MLKAQACLIANARSIGASAERLEAMPGNVPDLAQPVAGCAFAPRCERYLGALCDSAPPSRRFTGNPGQHAACYLYP